MKTFPLIIEKCIDTGLFVGYVPGFPGAHSQGKTIEELRLNMIEVIEMILEDGEPELEGEFIGLQNLIVG
jgi:predicted RNase H-like HicB family nuclease